MNLPIILAFGAMFGWGIGDFFIQKTIKKIGWLETLWWIYLGSFIFLLPLVYGSLIQLTVANFWLLIVLALVSILGAITHFKALEIGKLSVIEIILFFELPLTILLGVLFLKNKLVIYQGILILLLFIGVILISVDFNRTKRRWFWFFWQKKKILLEEGVLLAIITAILLALTNFFTAVSSTSINPLLVIWLPWTVGGLACFSYLLYQKRFKNIIRTGRRHWWLILIIAICDTAAWLCLSFSIAQAGELAIIASITEGYIVIAMLLGIKFNQEKIYGWQYLGAAITIVCSILIGLTSN